MRKRGEKRESNDSSKFFYILQHTGRLKMLHTLKCAIIKKAEKQLVKALLVCAHGQIPGIQAVCISGLCPWVHNVLRS